MGTVQRPNEKTETNALGDKENKIVSFEEKQSIDSTCAGNQKVGTNDTSVKISEKTTVSSKENMTSNVERLGVSGCKNGDNDNGLYTAVQVGSKVHANFLIDTGSSVTLLSETMYNRMDKNEQPSTTMNGTALIAVNGENIKQYGTGVVTLKLGNTFYHHRVTVCDLPVEGILGQDFIMKYITSIDYKNMKLHSESTVIPCWVGGKSQMRCQIESDDTHHIPAHSVRWISVRIPGKNHLADTFMLEPSSALARNRGIFIVPAICENKAESFAKVVNVTENEVVLYANQRLGHCESVYEQVQQNSKQSEAVLSVTANSPSNEENKDEDVPEHLKDLFERSCTHLDNSQVNQLKKALIRYQDVFAKSPEDMGLTDRVEHVIDTGDARPIRLPVRRQPIALQEIEKEEVEKMLKRNIIAPSNSPWSSPVTLVKKKDGSTRFCIDYRALNQITRSDSYPIPRIDDCLDALAGNEWFSTADLQSGFHQVPLAEDSKQKSAFRTKQGLFQWNVMPFGLTNSPATFERLMENVLTGLQWEECLLFIDDTIVPSKTFEEGLEKLQHVLQRFREAKLKVKASKCNFFKKKLQFLGHLVSAKGIEVSDEKVQAIKDWPVPRTTKETLSFVGLCSYYRKFCSSFEILVKPLREICKKGVKFNWTAECQTAFETLKEKLMTAPILSYPLPGLPYIVDTDASQFCVGAVLSQVQDGKERVIAYLSKSLNKAEQNYCVSRKELYAVVVALKKFHPYLYGQEVTLRTDNSAVSWMRSLKNPTGQTARWLEILETYNLKVQHRKGAKHSNADALSRRPCISCKRQQELNDSVQDDEEQVCQITAFPLNMGEKTEVLPKEQTSNALTSSSTGVESSVISAVLEQEVDQVPTCTNAEITHEENQTQKTQLIAVLVDDGQIPSCSTQPDPAPKTEATKATTVQFHPISPDGWDSTSMREAQMKDENISTILRAKEQNKKPSWPEIARQQASLKTLWAQWDRLIINEGVLYRKRLEDENDKQLQLIVPTCHRMTVVRNHHDIPIAGHLGSEKTSGRVKQSYYWPKMDEDIKLYCTRCDTCVTRKTSPKVNKAPLGNCGTGEPLERVSMDICGPFPLTENKQNRYILVVTDNFTRWVEAIALPNIEAKTVAQAFLTEFACKFGFPLEIKTDQGSNFESNLFREFCDLVGVYKTRTTSLHPQGNALCERFNRTLGNMLSAYCEKNQKNWDLYLPLVASGYRASVHSSTGMTPNKLMLGREVYLPMSLVVQKPVGEKLPTTDEYVVELQQKIQEVHALAREHLKKTTEYQKRHYDLKAKHKSFEEGQAVWLFNPIRRVGICQKFVKNWTGPYLVRKRVDDITYMVQKGPKEKAKAYHVDRLLAYTGNNTPVWIVKLRQSSSQ
mgnify:CR=1 FL=1